MSEQTQEAGLSIGVDAGDLSVEVRGDDPFARRMLDPVFADAYRRWLEALRQPTPAYPR